MQNSESATNKVRPMKVARGSPERIRRVVVSMRNHALVYQAADRLCISALKEYAIAQINDSLDEKVLASCHFLGLVELVYQVTAPTDIGLRRCMTEHCIENADEVTESKKMTEILMRYEQMAWTVGTALQEKLNGYRSELSELKEIYQDVM